MNYEKMILEMFERIIKLEDKVDNLTRIINRNVLEQKNEETMESKKYRFLTSYLRDSNAFSIRLTFAEIEEIIQTKLADSAKKHKEFWANSTSHSIAKSWLSANYRTVEINLEQEFVVFEKRILNHNTHMFFWNGFNEYALSDGRLLSHFKKLYNVTYESRYELYVAPNHTHIAFVRNVKDNSIVIEFYTRDKNLFDTIKLDKAQIESELGFPLEWKRLDGKLATRINYRKSFEYNESNQNVYAWLIEYAIKFKAIFSRYI